MIVQWHLGAVAAVSMFLGDHGGLLSDLHLESRVPKEWHEELKKKKGEGE